MIDSESVATVTTGFPIKEKGKLAGFGRDVINIVKGGIESVVNKTCSFINRKSGNSLDYIFDKIPGVSLIRKAKIEVLRRCKAIYPGTLWCGGGNISHFEDERGLFASADDCCKEHDTCPTVIDAGDTKYGLMNNGLFTRSHCDCDEKFYGCLLIRSKLSFVAAHIGCTYFNILGPQCFREQYPIKNCLNTTITESNLTKCVEYEYDLTATPIYQWFDNKLFWAIPFIS